MTNSRPARAAGRSSQENAALKADIDKGLADLAAGRVKNFDLDRLIKRGRKLLQQP
jgi:predicted transcriptional regulator